MNHRPMKCSLALLVSLFACTASAHADSVFLHAVIPAADTLGMEPDLLQTQITPSPTEDVVALSPAGVPVTDPFTDDNGFPSDEACPRRPCIYSSPGLFRALSLYEPEAVERFVLVEEIQFCPSSGFRLFRPPRFGIAEAQADKRRFSACVHIG